MRFDILVIGELNVDLKLKTSISTLLTKQAGDHAILTYPGSIGTLRSEQVGQSNFRHARHLHIGAYIGSTRSARRSPNC